MSPDAVCNYALGGTLNSQDYFTRADGSYHIWWDGIDTWTISAVLGTPGAEYWELVDPDPAGLYSPLGTATGNATVAVGTHV